MIINDVFPNLIRMIFEIVPYPIIGQTLVLHRCGNFTAADKAVVSSCEYWMEGVALVSLKIKQASKYPDLICQIRCQLASPHVQVLVTIFGFAGNTFSICILAAKDMKEPSTNIDIIFFDFATGTGLTL